MKGSVKVKSFERNDIHELAFVLNQFITENKIEIISLSHETNFGKVNAILVYISVK